MQVATEGVRLSSPFGRKGSRMQQFPETLGMEILLSGVPAWLKRKNDISFYKSILSILSLEVEKEINVNF